MCPPAITPFGPSQHRGNRRLRSRLSQAIFTHTHRHVRPRPIKSPQSTTLFQRPCLVLPDPVAAIQRAPFSFPVPVFLLLTKPCASSHGLVIAGHSSLFVIFLPTLVFRCVCVSVCASQKEQEPRCPPSPSSLPPPRARIEPPLNEPN